MVIVDGVNVEVLLPSGTHRTNRRGQRRQVKRREDRIILAALGVWPDGRHQVLYFERVDQETKANWKKFFQNLLAKGLDTSLLQLVVSDGRPGLHTAIRTLSKRYPMPCRGIRGATTVETDSAAAILTTTRELLARIVEANDVAVEDKETQWLQQIWS